MKVARFLEGLLDDNAMTIPSYSTALYLLLHCEPLLLLRARTTALYHGQWPTLELSVTFPGMKWILLAGVSGY